MATPLAAEEDQSLEREEREQDKDPPTIDGVPIPEFLRDAPPRYHIFGA